MKTPGKNLGRWEGRNLTKDELRVEVWNNLENQGASIGPVFSHIPNFEGADRVCGTGSAYGITVAVCKGRVPGWMGCYGDKCRLKMLPLSKRIRIPSAMTCFVPASIGKAAHRLSVIPNSISNPLAYQTLIETTKP